ncbi:MAG: tetraacyldisaccharide 4'-kinase [Desulfovibrio sp.]
MSALKIQRILRPLLLPFSLLYSLGMVMREHLFASGVFRSWQAPVPVISVGNISWGGTGKTPLCNWLLKWAALHRYTPAVLTRGYGAKPERLPYVVSPNSMAEVAGDEPLLLAKRNKHATVVVDPVRRRAGKWACKNAGANLLLLDDGFQHMAVQRDLNLVLLTPDDLRGDWNATHPGGPWREGQVALKRADAFLIKCHPEKFREMRPEMKSRLSEYGSPVFNFYMGATSVRQVSTQNREPGFGGEKYILITGVGSPEQVVDTAKDLIGYGPKEHLSYPDHHMYTKKDVTDILRAMRRHGCKFVLCTGKDAVKLGPLAGGEFWELEFNVYFGPAAGSRLSFDTWLETRWDSFISSEKRAEKKHNDDGEPAVKAPPAADDPIAAYGDEDDDLLDMMSGDPMDALEIPDVEIAQKKKESSASEEPVKSTDDDLIERVNKELYEQEKKNK